VTVTEIDGTQIFGSNSRSPTYRMEERIDAERIRDHLILKYPETMNSDNIGEKPNDALFHAEATVLLRAARQYGGTLAGRTIEVHSDRPMCPSCYRVLPLLGQELGNPTVTFVSPRGSRKTMRNGYWID
jgi:hypothetical protein